MAKNLLNNPKTDNKAIYGNCYLLGRYLHQEGKTMEEAREILKEWLQKCGCEDKIHGWLNGCISKAYQNNQRLTENQTILVQKEDIDEIIKRFDLKNTRLVALAILCYAKAFANNDNEFLISTYGLQDWIDIRHDHISNRYIKELINFGYLEKVTSGSITWYKNLVGQQMTRYRIKVPIHNKGEYELKNNDIQKLYAEVFNKNAIQDK